MDLDLKNTFLLPHIGSATIETRTAMGMLALDNIDAVPAGEPATSLVIPAREIVQSGAVPAPRAVEQLLSTLDSRTPRHKS